MIQSSTEKMEEMVLGIGFMRRYLLSTYFISCPCTTWSIFNLENIDQEKPN